MAISFVMKLLGLKSDGTLPTMHAVLYVEHDRGAYRAIFRSRTSVPFRMSKLYNPYLMSDAASVQSAGKLLSLRTPPLNQLNA